MRTGGNKEMSGEEERQKGNEYKGGNKEEWKGRKE